MFPEQGLTVCPVYVVLVVASHLLSCECVCDRVAIFLVLASIARSLFDGAASSAGELLIREHGENCCFSRGELDAFCSPISRSF
jgi:hypothetical protein